MIFEFGGILLLMAAVIFLSSAIWIFREYERGVVFFLGRFQKVAGPGLVLINPQSRKSYVWTCAPSCSKCRHRT